MSIWLGPTTTAASYDASLKVRPHDALSLYGHGLAKCLKGDIAAALKADPEIAEEYKRNGVPCGTAPLK